MARQVKAAWWPCHAGKIRMLLDKLPSQGQYLLEQFFCQAALVQSGFHSTMCVLKVTASRPFMAAPGPPSARLPPSSTLPL